MKFLRWWFEGWWKVARPYFIISAAFVVAEIAVVLGFWINRLIHEISNNW